VPFVLMSGIVDEPLREKAVLADAVYEKDMLLAELPSLVRGVFVHEAA
jgi:hypothetical protein